MKHCLVVDDSAVIRKVARRILEGLSLRVSEAEHGEQALAACRVEMPDAILLDCVMPVMDGFDFLKEFKKLGGADRPRIVFSMIEHDVAHLARAKHAGASDHILKPFDRSLLTAKFQEIGVV